MMAKRTQTCSSCGSIKPDDRSVCDICGHDARSEARTEPPTEAAAAGRGPASSASAAMPAAMPAATPKQARGPQRPSATRSAKAGRKDAAPALFSTPQWIAIVVAAFILGGVLSASFISRDAGTASGGATTAGNAGDGAQPDMQRLTETRAAMEANPDNPDALLAYSHALHDSGMPAQAIVQYKRYLEFRPDDPDARVDLGICYFETKDYATAISEMERAVAKFPDHQLGNYNLGIVNLNAGNKDKAREWFEKARDIDPSSPHGQNAAQLLGEHF